MSSIVLRAAAVSDLDRITEIYADAVTKGTASYELEPPTRAEMDSRFGALTEGGFPYIAAENDGVLAGYAYAGPFRPRPAYRFVVEDSIYVAQEAKGQGIGRLLLERLIAEAESCGFRQMIAVIGDGSPESPSVKLHEKLGFRQSGVLRGSGYKHGRWLDTVFMQLSMNSGTEAAPDPESLPERRFMEKIQQK
jgi:L-amino acid N-acyltransferase YncA